MKTITLTCAGCGKSFEKPKNEWLRQLRTNPDRVFYCMMSCYGHSAGKDNLGSHIGVGNPDAFRAVAGSRQDNFSAFKYFMNKARNRVKRNGQHHDCDIDLPYLKFLWDQQAGRCSLSGIPMHLPRNTSDWEKTKWDPWRASLDRIDCTKGYVQGNVRFTTLMGNLCRNGFPDEDVVQFCKAVVSASDNK